MDLAEPVTPDLPWGVFHLFAGHFASARSTLAFWAEGRPPAPAASALAALALGDALWELGRFPEALAAYRDGYGLAPDGAGWRPADPGLPELRRRAESDPVLAGDWWAVGACIEGRFPAFGRADRDQSLRWLRRFEAAVEGLSPAPVV